MVVPSYTYFLLRKYKLNFQWRKQDTLVVFTWDWLVFIFLSCNTSIKGMIFYFRIILFQLFWAWKMGTHLLRFLKKHSQESNYEVWRDFDNKDDIWNKGHSGRKSSESELLRWAQKIINSQFNPKAQGTESGCTMIWKMVAVQLQC